MNHDVNRGRAEMISSFSTYVLNENSRSSTVEAAGVQKALSEYGMFSRGQRVELVLAILCVKTFSEFLPGRPNPVDIQGQGRQASARELQIITSTCLEYGGKRARMVRYARITSSQRR
jgi:hypothetical protein